MCFFIVIALSLFGLIVMMPINATGTNKYLPEPLRVSGTSILSMANIDPNDRLRLGFQVLAVIVNSFIFCLFLYLFLRVFVKYRVKHKRLHLVENYTVGITGYDLNKWKQERILQFYTKLFPERIYSMHTVPNVPKLDALHEERFDLVLKKEAMVVKKRKAKGPDYVSKSVEKLDQKIKNIDQKLQYLENRPREQMNDEIPRTEQEEEDGTKMGKVKRSMKAVNICNSEKSPSNNLTNTTYATFQTMGDAHICSRIITGTEPRWQVFPAPNPKEVYWRNHTPNVGSITRRMMFILGIIIFFCLIVFWIIPVAAATGLSNLQTIASIPGFGALVTFAASNAIVKSIIEGFLPQLVIIIFYIILIPLIGLLVNKTFFPLNRTEKIRSVMTIYFTFKIVNIYCAGLLTNSFWTIIDKLETIVAQPIVLINLLGEAVPAQAIFFINYILVAALRDSFLALWKPGALVSEGLGLCCLATTPRDYRELYRPEMFFYRGSFPDRMFVLILVLCYSNIAPLILPFGILYFLLMIITETHRLLFVCRQKSFGGGLLWCTMFNQGCFGAGLYAVTMLGVFILKTFVAGIVISILVLVAIVVFAVYMNRRWFPIAEYGSYDRMMKYNKIVPESDGVFHNLYVTPSLLPVAQDKLEYYGDDGDDGHLEKAEQESSNKNHLTPDNPNLSEMNSETERSKSQTIHTRVNEDT
jgi:hypothetical protein